MKTEQGLTQQQEKFAQGVASGLTQADDYRSIRDTYREKLKELRLTLKNYVP